eukprot:4327457-Lingulodinium_polyedra.AAC.1
MECANREMRGAVAMACSSERVYEQLSRETAQQCVQKRITLLRCRTVRDVRTPCVKHHVVVD